MKEIHELRNRGALLSLDELVAKANELLPHILPEAEKLRQSELNPRLVRHFATLGLVDEAGRDGREARYGARHLLQLLVVRRLMAEGSTTSGVKKLIVGALDAELESLLLSGVRRANLESYHKIETVEVENEALQWLHKIRARNAPMSSPASWRRIAVENGLELHIREDFRAPNTPYEREQLLRRIEDELKKWLKKPRGKST